MKFQLTQAAKKRLRLQLWMLLDDLIDGEVDQALIAAMESLLEEIKQQNPGR